MTCRCSLTMVVEPGLLAAHSPPALRAGRARVHLSPPADGFFPGRVSLRASPPARSQALRSRSCLRGHCAHTTEFCGTCHACPAHPHAYITTALLWLWTEKSRSREIDSDVLSWQRRAILASTWSWS